MKITIKHNIKRDGCTLSGQLLDCQFLDSAERGDRVPYYGKNEEHRLMSCGYCPELWGNTFFVWAERKERDLNMLSYTYPTEEDAQDMLDFINTFVEEDETVKDKELKPCPFCGGKAKVYIHCSDYPDEYSVSCIDCGVGTSQFKIKEDAIKVWNNRI